MDNLKIILPIDGEVMEFAAPAFISSSVFSKTLELEHDLENPQDYDVIFKKLYPLICDVFGNQFTPEQLQRGVDIRAIIPLAHEVIEHVIVQMQLTNKVANFFKKKVSNSG